MSAPAPTSPPSTNSTAPPPATPSAPPPATPSAPPPSPPAAAPPPATPSAPPPATPSTPPPAPATPSTPSAPAPASPSPPTTPSPSPPSPPSNNPSPPSSTTPPATPTPVTPSTPTPITPSTPGSRTPPSSSSGGSPPNSSSPPSNSSSISTGTVVGIAIGGVAILLILSLFCICRKRRRRGDNEAAYYAPPPPPSSGPKVDPYGGQPQQHWQQVAPPPPDRVVGSMGKPPPAPPAPARQPPQQPAYLSSSGASNYSGTETPLPPPSPGLSLGFSKSMFTYEELARATDGFSDANLLGQGGFGYVHRGVLPNGKEVAIKQLKVGSGQGEREFQAEVEIISRVHHKHLVSLVGYCITGAQRLLVYEFVQNDTLEFHLHGKGRPTMEWPTRLKIALGSAKGLAYLHEDCHPKIIHRDIKAANILLDFKFEAKVADFGLAKFTSDANTHVSTRVMGTFGYLAPEYAASGKLSDKSDVFSFGVMLLELITGRRPVDTTHTYMDDSLVDWARPLLSRALEDGNYDSLVDQKLVDYDHNEMSRMVACAAACVRHSARRRPRMSQVVRALEGDVSLADLNEGIKPGHSRMYSYESSDYDTSQYNEDMKKFRKMALGSKEYGASDEYSGPPTSDYGLYPSGSSSEGQTTREMEMGKVKRNSQGFSGSS
ncbi:unnamed protein product [Linum tenue]|uniref:non-specific serine/threonine protein kinase n=1 Tax=Linum tenue TaxID=586396 RepID=A0AAV0QDH5_9ROSI|nr:unnamed protein product [Linum tenue]